MNTDEATTKMKAKLNAFFAKATTEDISALLKRTNYDFYKNVQVPQETQEEEWQDIDPVRMSGPACVLTIPVASISHHGVPNRPVIYIGRGPHFAVDHQDLALAA